MRSRSTPTRSSLPAGRTRRSWRRGQGVELPIRPLVRQLADVGPVGDLPGDLPMTIEENGFHFRRVGLDGLRLAMVEPELRWDGPAAVRDDLVEDWRERLALALPAGCRRAAAAGVGGLLRHDARCASDHRAGRRRRLCRLRLLRPRLHAVAGCRRRGRGRAPRRRTAVRSLRRTGSTGSGQVRSSPRRSCSSGTSPVARRSERRSRPRLRGRSRRRSRPVRQRSACSETGCSARRSSRPALRRPWSREPP